MKKQLLEQMLIEAEKSLDTSSQKLRFTVEGFNGNHTIGNFNVTNIQKDFMSFKDETYCYNITFRHCSQDVDFTINNKKGVDRFGWSSTSHYNLKTPDEQKDAIKQSRYYIQAVSEMLQIMEDYDATMEAVELIAQHWIADIEPLIKEQRDYDKAYEEIKKEIKAIEKEEIVAVAREYLVGKTRYVSDGYHVTNKHTTREIAVSEDKGKLYIDNFGRRKSITEQDLVSIYNHVTKTMKRYDWGDEKHYSYPNELPSKNAKIIETEITKEEYLAITR